MRGKDWLVNRLAQKPPQSDERWTWATVTTAGGDGLRVKLDGDSGPLDVPVENLLGWCAVDERVRVHRYGRRVLVVGRATSDTDWTDLDLADGYAGVSGDVPQVRALGGLAHFRGSFDLSVGSWTTGGIVATTSLLPDAPARAGLVGVTVGDVDGTCNVAVSSSGNLYIWASTTATQLSLGGCYPIA